MDIEYVLEYQPLGTGGGVRLAMAKCQEEHVFVFNGDTFLDLEVDAVEQHWKQHRHPIVVGKWVSDTARYGRLLTNEGRVTGFTVKGITGSGPINAGCYVFNKGQLDSFPCNTPFSLEADYLAKVVAVEQVDVFETAAKFIDIGVPEDFERAQRELSGLYTATD